MRLRVAIAGMVVALGVAAGVASAQQPVPTVTVDSSPSVVTVNAPGPIPAGPTRMNFVRPAGGKDLSVYVALLVPGVSLDQLRQTIASDDASGGEASLGLVSIQASTALAGADTQRAVTFNVKPGLTYVVLVEQDTERGAPPRAFTTFASAGTPNGATAPAPAASVTFQGLRFRGPGSLPQNGTVRFANRDGVAHFALAFPLRKGTTKARLGRALRGNSQRAFGRVVAGAPYTAQNIISGGDTSNDQEVRFPKKGRYGLVCFVNEHQRLGMYRIVTVR
jgi:plastocyanin